MVVIAKIKAKSGDGEKIENAFKEAMPKVAQEEGTLGYSLIKDQNDPLSYIVVEKYKDMDAFMAHGATDYLAEMIGAIAPWLDGDLTLDIYDEVTEM